MARILGIDLGTTNSCVAALDDGGTPRVLSAADGRRITPSVVAYSEDGVVVGAAARRQMVTNPASTIYGTKRLVGRKVNAPDVGWFARSAPFEIVAAPNGDAWIRIGGQPRSPQEVASHVLRRMRAIAEESCGESVTRAVITVPAYFDDAQRQATRDAGTIAGLDVVRLLNEPTAAALAYGAHRVRSGRRVIAVFDLGGGTFDISIMAVEDGVFEVLATGGESSLGGDDWDRLLVEHLVGELERDHGIDPTRDPVAMSRLVEAAEASKRALSSEQSTTLQLPYLASTGAEAFHYSRALGRDELDLTSASFRDRLRQPCQRALDDAGLLPSDLEEVLLVGGMSRNLAVQELVTEIFGRAPSKSVNPDEVVALGAAAYAGILAGQLDDAALLDVTPHTIGIKIGDSFTPVIPRNSMLPVRERKLFATSHDDQRYVAVEIYQGEHADVRKNRKLGNVRLENLPPGKAGSVRVELSMTVDVESILQVTARELSTGRSTQVRIEPTGGLSAGDLSAIVERRRGEERDE